MLRSHKHQVRAFPLQHQNGDRDISEHVNKFVKHIKGNWSVELCNLNGFVHVMYNFELESDALNFKKSLALLNIMDEI